MNAKIDMNNVGLSLPSLPVIKHNFTEKSEELEEEGETNEEFNRDSTSSVSEDDDAAPTSCSNHVPRVNFSDDNDIGEYRMKVFMKYQSQSE